MVLLVMDDGMDEDPPIKFFFEKKNLHNSKREREIILHKQIYIHKGV